MIRNYLKIALRNLVKNKVYSFINIGGLAVGMSVAMLIGLWIYDELSFNKHHKNYDKIAKVMRSISANGETYDTDYVPYVLGNELDENYKNNFKHLAIALPFADYILATNDIKLSRKGEFIESTAPEMLSLKMVKGSHDGLKDLNAILVSQSTAKALFGEADPINKFVKINDKLDTKVTGVYEDLPKNSHFHEVSFFSPLDLYISKNEWIKTQGWDNNFVNIYAEIQGNPIENPFEFENISKQIKDAQSRHESSAYKSQVFLNPMKNWHLYSDFKNGVIENTPIRYIWLVGSIGVFILLLACINFMNLSTARSSKRSKEVGLRKAIGSMKSQLVFQFLSESFLVVILAFLLALLLVIISLPYFNNLAEKQIIVLWNSYWFWFSCVGFVLLTSLISGSYPAFYLSSFQTIKVLKGTLQGNSFAANSRKFLVVFQYVVSVTLVICTIFIYNQIMFTKNRPVGYARNGLLMIEEKTGDYSGKYDLLRSELKNTGAVLEMSKSEGKVSEIWSNVTGFNWKDKNPLMKESFGTLSVSYEYGKTIGWQIIDGRDFSRQYATDSAGIIVNEAAVKYMGLKNPVGEIVGWIRKEKSYKIVGVAKNMVMTSPYQAAVPTIFFIDKYANTINIRLNPATTTSKALPKIEAVFKKYVPNVPFEYKFADMEYNLKFSEEEKIGRLSSLFAILAIFISCLGLFGLASFVAEQRTKEIGIRKVLGASVSNLWQLLSKDFVVLVVISCLIAAPIAYYFMNTWLQKYTYRTEISWLVFVISGFGALLITLLTVSYQAIKVALMNPVKSLKTE